MTLVQIRRWLNEYDGIFGELQETATAVGETSGAAGSAVERYGRDDPRAESALSKLREAATQLLSVARKAEALPRFPDETTQTAFSATLRRWIDSAETMIAAAAAKDPAEMHRAARAGEAGSLDFLRMAAAILRASGQPPDPNNPLS